MIPDYQCNKVWFADETAEDFPNELNGLKKIIESEGYSIGILKGTADYFCRDYMSIQVRKNDFVQFEFRPQKYLKKSEWKYISEPLNIILVNQLPAPRQSLIALDGGNVIRWEDKVIITDRVIKDNISYFKSTQEILKELELKLQCHVIIIPEYPGEPTGHADGLIRFVNSNTVLINKTADDPNQEWVENFLNELSKNNLSTIEIPCALEDGQDNASGLYINYLHVGKLIIVPQFKGLETENVESVRILTKTFLDCKVIPFEADWIARFGGVFNCASWNILN